MMALTMVVRKVTRRVEKLEDMKVGKMVEMMDVHSVDSLGDHLV
jgi:hypothetical protein